MVPYEFISPNGNGANETWVIENGAQHEDLRISVQPMGCGGLLTRGGLPQHVGRHRPQRLTSAFGDVLLGVESESGLLAPVHGFLEDPGAPTAPLGRRQAPWHDHVWRILKATLSGAWLV